MCQGRLSVFYGFYFKAWTLARAAKAHPHLVGPLLARLALDLINRRLGLGTLQTTSGAGAQIVSKEVWSMIRTELCFDELQEAESSWIDKVRCTRC